MAKKNRYRDALNIQFGASNPSGIAQAIVDACNEIRENPRYTGTAQIANDPAVRLMVHQLAFICGVTSGAEGFAKSNPCYTEAMKICRDMCDAEA